MHKEVFVIGGCHHNLLGVIRSFGEMCINPFVIIETKDINPYVAKSKYIKKCWIVEKELSVLGILIKEAGRHGDKPVVIACADNLSSLLDTHRDELREYYTLPGAEEQGRITKLMNKEEMSRLALQTGFLVPMSVAVDTSEKQCIDIPLPWIVKPLVSKDGLKSDIERIYTKEDWDEYCNKHSARVQVQQLIDKDFEYQLIGLSLNSGEEVVIPGVSHVIRPAATTNTGFLHYDPLSDSYCDVLEKGKNFLKATGYSGLFSLEFLKGKDGSDFFMEINFRNDGNAICVTAAGLNLPYIWYLYHAGGNYKDIIDNYCIKGVYVMPEFADLSLVIHRELGLREWLKDIKRTDRFMEYDKNDKKPFWQLLKVSVLRGFQKMIQ